MTGALLIRNVEIDGRAQLDIRIEQGRIAEIGRNLRTRADAIDANGAACIAGLVDHHVHLLATAAAMQSVRVDPETSPTRAAFAAALRSGARRWVRAIGYHESIAGPLDRDVLDAIVPNAPVRVQYATGSLWALNSCALERALRGEPAPDCVERDAAGRPTGRIWRGDAWLRERIGADAPNLAALGALLASKGIVAVTDASATTGPAEARLLADKVRSGVLPQRLTLMSGGALRADECYAIGPVKILLDEADLPDFDDLLARIEEARAWGRTVAMHCATEAELAFAVAALETAGVERGDRIEHGSIIPEAFIDTLARLELTIVTQPAFIAERGDRYVRDVPRADHASLYRVASLRRAGVKLAFSTDAPYGAPDPWRAIAAATTRRTPSGAVLGSDERISARSALALFQSPIPGGRRRRVAVGARADLCVLATPLAEALRDPSATSVTATIRDGVAIHGSAAMNPERAVRQAVSVLI